MDQQRGRFAPWAALAAAVVACTSVLAQPNTRFRLETVAAWGGPVNGFVRDGNIGYCTSGQRLVVLDMTNEASPVEVAAVNIRSTVRDLAKQGNYLYVVADNPWPLTTISVANPLAPVVTAVDDSNGPAGVGGSSRVRLNGNMMYVLNRTGSSPVSYSLADPAHPAWLPPEFPFVGFFDENGLPVRLFDLRVEGSLGYVGDDVGNLRVYNLDDPLHPVHLGRVLLPATTTGARVHCVSIHGNRALVQGLHDASPGFTALVDISTPTSPTRLGVLYTAWVGSTSAALVGNYALVCDQSLPSDCDPPSKGFAVIDFTNPANPLYIGGYHMNYSDTREVRVQGDRAYVSCMGEGLVIFDIANPAQPVRIGGYYSPGLLRDCAKEGNRLYVSDTWNGFTVLDVSNPSATPAVVGIYRTTEPCGQDHRNILVRNNVAYLAGGRSGVHIVNVDPLLPGPSFISKILPPGEVRFEAFCVALDGNVLHVSTKRTHLLHPQELRLYDISSPTTPQPPLELGRTDAPNANAMVSKDGYTHTARANTGGWPLYCDIYNCTNPAAPFVAGQIAEGANDIAREGNILLTTKNDTPDRGLHILNVTNPVLPQRIGLVPSGAGWGVGIQGTRAYFGGRRSEDTLEVLDIGNPAAPQPLAYIWTFPAKIRVDGDMIYTTCSRDNGTHNGVVVHRFRCYANCDNSTTLPVLTVQDFACFLNKYASGDSGANCDNSTAVPVLTVQDFSCFLNYFAAGCN